MPSVIRASLRCGLIAASAAAASAAAPRELVKGANFLFSGAVHPASGDILLLTDPGDQTKSQISVAVLPAGSSLGADMKSLPVVDDGSVAAGPTDVAFVGDRAYVTDQGRSGVVSFERKASGKWQAGKKWLLKDLLPACDDQGRYYGEPEAIAAGPKGELYVSLSVTYGKRCLLHPLDHCCVKVSSSTAVMSLDPARGALTEVFNTKSFFNLNNDTTKDEHFHIRGMDVMDNGDIVVVGYGDDGVYFGHSAWRWQKQTQQVQLFAGQDSGPEGKAGEGDGGEATKGKLNLPWGLTVSGGDVYISEAGGTDVRRIAHGIITSVEDAPHGDSYANNYFRKIHRGAKPGTLLLAVSGLGTNEGRLVEFDAPQGVKTLVV